MTIKAACVSGISIAAALVLPARAEPASDDEAAATELDGVRYLRLETVPWAFAATRLEMATQAGLLQFPVIFALPGDRGTGEGTEFDVELASTLESFRLDVAVTPRIAVGARLGGGGVFALERRSAIVAGVAAGGIVEADLVGVLVRQERLLLSVRGDLGLVIGQAFSPARLIDSIEVEDGDITYDSSQLIAEHRDRTITPSAVAAYTLTPWLGAQAGLGAELRSSRIEGETEGLTTLFGAVGANADLGWLGLLVAGGVHHEVGAEDDERRSLFTRPRDPTTFKGEVGAYYIGTVGLEAGLTLTTEIGDEQRHLINMLRMAYTW